MNLRFSPVAVAGQLSAGSICATLYIFLRFTSRPVLGVAPVWLVIALVAYVLNFLLLQRERSVQAMLCINAPAAVLSMGVLLLWGGMGSGESTALCVIGCVFLFAQGASLVQKPQTLARTVQWLDLCLILLILFTAYLGAVSASLLAAVPLMIGCGAAVFALVSYRSGEQLTPPGVLCAGIILLILCGVARVLIAGVATEAGQGARSLWSGLSALSAAVWEAINRFMRWFSSLFPEETLEMTAEGTEATAELSGGDTARLALTLPTWVLVSAGVLVIALAVFLLYKLSGVKTGGLRMSGTGGQTLRRSRPSLLAALLRYAADLLEGARLRLFLLHRGNTVLGVYYTLLHRAAPRSWRAGHSRSPREFLAPLAEKASSPALKSALNDLTVATEQALFAPQSGNPDFPRAALIRREAGRLLPKTPGNAGRKGRKTQKFRS